MLEVFSMNKITLELRKGSEYSLDHLRYVFIGEVKFSDKSDVRYFFHRVTEVNEILMLKRIQVLEKISPGNFEIKVVDPDQSVDVVEMKIPFGFDSKLSNILPEQNLTVSQWSGEQIIDAVATANEKILGAVND